MSIQSLLKLTKALSPAVDHTKLRLVTIGFSHFSEKARWAMDLSPYAADYVEELHCPALHLSSTLLNLSNLERVATWDFESNFSSFLNKRHEGKIGRIKSKTGVPKLVLPAKYVIKSADVLDVSQRGPSADSRVVDGGSSGILKFLSDVYPHEMGHLYPSTHENAVIELEHLLDTEFAPAVTQWDFGNILLTGAAFQSALGVNHNENVQKYFVKFLTSQPVPFIEKILSQLLGTRFIVPLMIKANHVYANETVKAADKIHNIFAQMDVLLTKNNPTGDVHSKFLLGTEQITAADIAFASFAACVLFPPQTARLFPALSELQGLTQNTTNTGKPYTACGATNLVNLAQELRHEYRSAQYVLDLYTAQRFRVHPPGYTVNGPEGLKSGESDKKSDVKSRIVQPRVRW